MMNDERIEQLISHAIDGKLNDNEWAEFARAAQSDSSLWLRLAKAYEDHRALAETMRNVSTVAERVELPEPAAACAPAPDAGESDRDDAPVVLARLRPIGAWLGWAVAAVLALAWIGQPLSGDSSGSNGGNDPSGVVSQASLINSPEDALQWYLKEGREQGQVVGELPERILVDQKPAESGDGYELLYVRQILERTRVPNLYQFAGQDESGRPSLVQPVNFASQSM